MICRHYHCKIFHDNKENNNNDHYKNNDNDNKENDKEEEKDVVDDDDDDDILYLPTSLTHLKLGSQYNQPLIIFNKLNIQLRFFLLTFIYNLRSSSKDFYTQF